MLLGKLGLAWLSRKIIRFPSLYSAKKITSLPKLRFLSTMKLDSQEFHNLFTPELKELVSIFDRHKFEIRIVGGAVRDLLMGQQPHDIDFATTATPEAMKEMFEKESIRMLNLKGERHGTVTVRINEKVNFEVTTLRIDVLTNGRHAEVSFTTDWHLDAARRDLTINAMFLGMDGTVYDYFHGIEDVKDLRIAFVGDIAKRLQEDFLRILRYFRFYGRISKEADNHDENVLNIIRENMEGISTLSGERIMSELRKILTGNFPKELMLRMIDLGIGPHIGFPSHLNIEDFKIVCERSLPLKPVSPTLIAALLSNEEEVLSFQNRMHMSSYERDLCLFIIKHRTDSDADFKELRMLIFTNSAKPSDVHEWICELLKYRGQKDLLQEFVQTAIPNFPINGHDLMLIGVKKGPSMGYILNELKREWSESDFETTREKLLERANEIQRKRIKKD